MKRISYGLALTALIFGTTADAGTLNAVINGKSYHVGATRDWNENNYGFGLEYHFETDSLWKTSAMANGFRDSEDQLSYMAGGSLHRRLVESHRFGGFYLDAGLTAFLMTRRDVNDNRPFPGILPSLAIGNRHVGFNLAYMPEEAVRYATNARFSDPAMESILYLQVKFNIDRLLPQTD